jgi:hypothetical protein
MRMQVAFIAILVLASLAGAQTPVQITGTGCTKFVGTDAGLQISACISAALRKLLISRIAGNARE